MRRRDFVRLLVGAAAAVPLPTFAQKSSRIGWLVFGDASLGPTDQSLKDALAQNGLVDGRTVSILYRFANGDLTRVPALAEELAAQKPDVLIAFGGDLTKALFDASKGSIAVVGGVSDDPVRMGLASSLARPGKNFTGVTFLTNEMAAKRIELLKEVVPGAKQIAVIFNPQHLDDELTFARKAAESLSIAITAYPINNAGDLDAALQSAKENGADCLFVIASRLTRVVAGRIAQYGLAQRLPVITAWREFVTNGALLSYGPSLVFEARRVAGYVDKVLKGRRPADLPIEQPVKFELVVNLKTARSIGLTLDRSLLLRADDLIE
ncbi:MAG TPA: ABC transporter substrate-binding protein [Pseudolabrys sp.]|nr:ABC transporter substrate-binding protein [Pseudolabrys sp.]